MNIKGLFNNIPTLPIRPTDKVDRAIKSDSTHDRDANGQQMYDQGSQQQGPMSDEQLEKSIEHLRSLPFVQEHGWMIELVTENDRKFVLVKDKDNKLIRRIPEEDLWTLPLDFNEQKGQLLRKSA